MFFVSKGLCEVVVFLRRKQIIRRHIASEYMLLSMSQTTWLIGAHMHICRLHLDYHVQKWDFNIRKNLYNLVPVESRPVGLIDPSDVPIVRHLGLQASVNISFKIFGQNYCFISPDMEFVQNFTPPDFQAKNFTQSISPNFNSLSLTVRKNTKNE